MQIWVYKRSRKNWVYTSMGIQEKQIYEKIPESCTCFVCHWTSLCEVRRLCENGESAVRCMNVGDFLWVNEYRFMALVQDVVPPLTYVACMKDFTYKSDVSMTFWCKHDTIHY